jgi:hypothetical protein
MRRGTRDLADAIKLNAVQTYYYRENYYSTRARAESDDESNAPLSTTGLPPLP